MGKKQSPYTEIEPGLQQVNREYIQWNATNTHRTKIKVLKFVKKIINMMKVESPAFAQLNPTLFGAGSSFEGLKVGRPDEFDVDILLTLPLECKPVLREDSIPGFVQLQLQGFYNLAKTHPELYKVMRNFVDDQNFLLTTHMKSTFMQSDFDTTFQKQFPNGSFKGDNKKITKVRYKGPAITLTVNGFGLESIDIDLVPCISLTKDHWPQKGFLPNPYIEPSEFFIVAKEPKRAHPHLERYWRMSFQKQEWELIFNCYWLKPTIRLMKCMRDHFHQNTSSYAIKTLFFLENEINPGLWRGPLSYCFIYMLEKYLQALKDHKISYYWYRKLDLLDNLTEQQKDQYAREVETMLNDIKRIPTKETVLKYFG